MPDSLPVHVNRASLHSLEVPDGFETDGSFDVRLINHGEPIHVHLHLDDSLSNIASIDAPNHHVDRQSERLVSVDIHRPESVLGSLKIVTSYGAETRYVDIDIAEPTEAEESVQVDESLSKPQPQTGGSSSTASTGSASQENPARSSLLDDRDLPVPVLALGAIAVVLALSVAAVIGETIAWIAAVVVLAAVAGASYLLVAE